MARRRERRSGGGCVPRRLVMLRRPRGWRGDNRCPAAFPLSGLQWHPSIATNGHPRCRPRLGCVCIAMTPVAPTRIHEPARRLWAAHARLEPRTVAPRRPPGLPASRHSFVRANPQPRNFQALVISRVVGSRGRRATRARMPRRRTRGSGLRTRHGTCCLVMTKPGGTGYRLR